MKTLILASAAVLTLEFGSAFAATSDTAQQNQQQYHQQVAMSPRASGAQTGSAYDQSFTAPANNTPHVGGWQPLPPHSTSGGN
jgi:hypothetical protein